MRHEKMSLMPAAVYLYAGGQRRKDNAESGQPPEGERFHEEPIHGALPESSLYAEQGKLGTSP
jgi:hypothetical protein